MEQKKLLKTNKKLRKLMRNQKKKYIIIKKDPIYKSEILNRFVNRIMVHGKKTKCLHFVYSAFKKIKRIYRINPNDYFNQITNKYKIEIDLKPARMGSTTIHIPYLLKGNATYKHVLS
jgi:small subunit ribosomal protein S7